VSNDRIIKFVGEHTNGADVIVVKASVDLLVIRLEARLQRNIGFTLRLVIAGIVIENGSCDPPFP